MKNILKTLTILCLLALCAPAFGQVPITSSVIIRDGSNAAHKAAVDGSGNVSTTVTSSALPAGAATSAKQPALGTAGTPSADVLSIQGILNMIALKVDGSAVTQPVSGTFWPYALGQQLNANSVPVVLTAAQLTTLTPPAAITNYAQEAGGNLAAIKADVDKIPASPATAGNQTAVQSAPGTPQTTAVTIQGNASGVPVPITGSITANNASVGSTGSAVPASATLIAGKNGSGNLTAITTDSSGNAAVNIENSPTVTANAGTGTFAISANALPLPTGAAVASKQPALGAPGISSTDVITVQGVSAMTPLKVDGSGVTQPISATSIPTPAPQTSGGVTETTIQTASGTNATSVKASAGQIYGWNLYNNTSSAEWIHLYNTSGTPTAGSATNYVTSIGIAPFSYNAYQMPSGIPYSSGIGYTITKGFGSADTTSVAAGDITGSLYTK